MSQAYWADMRVRLLLPNAGQGAIPLEKPTEEAVRVFEEQSGVSLPNGYVEFIKEFGPGEIFRAYRIRGPGYTHEGDTVDLLSFSADLHGRFSSGYIAERDDFEQIDRLLFFADDSGTGNVLGWDPMDVQDSKHHEYGIYLLGSKPLLKVANTFQELIEKGYLEAEAHDQNPMKSAELGPTLVFVPAWRTT